MVSNTSPKHQFECVLQTSTKGALTLMCPFFRQLSPRLYATIRFDHYGHSVTKYHLFLVTMYSPVDFASAVWEMLLSDDLTPPPPFCVFVFATVRL